MAVTTPVKKDPEPEKNADNEERKQKVTPDSISNKQLLHLIWINAGSPYGSAEEWLKRDEEVHDV